MVPIPYAMRYRSTVRAQVPKLVQCEQCGFEYVYVMERTGVGEGTSLFFLNNSGAQDRAAAEAQARVVAKLNADCDPVPCPACGHYQSAMVPRARKLRYRWMGQAALYMVPLIPILGIPAIIAGGIYEKSGNEAALVVAILLGAAAVTSILGAPGFPVLQYFLRRRYDPNTEDVESRKEQGRSRAVGKEDFLKSVQERRA